MNLKDDAKRTIDDLSDKINEIGHKTKAEAERARRDVASDTMTPR